MVKYTYGQELRVTGRISQEPAISSWKQTFQMAEFTVEAPKWPSYVAGEKLLVEGVVKESLRSKGSFSWLPERQTLVAKRIEVVDRNVGLVGRVMGIRSRAEAIYQNLLPEPQASLLSGIVWGGRQGLPDELLLALKRTSTMHVVAASGMNVTLVAGFFVSSLVVLLTREWAIVVGILGIMAYVIAAGGLSQPSVVRAGVMATAFLLAQFFGRQYDGFRFLIGTGVLMLVINPFWLFEIGWQLSMAATGGLMVMSSLASGGPEGRMTDRKKSGKLWGLLQGDFGVSLAAALATLPIMVGNFGQLSIVAPLVNALVLWTVAPLMMIGFLILIVGLIWLPLAGVISFVAWGMLSYFVFLVEIFGRLPWAAVEGISIPSWFGAGYYLGLGLLVLGIRKRVIILQHESSLNRKR